MPPWVAKRAGAKSVVPYAGVDPDQVQRVLLLVLCSNLSPIHTFWAPRQAGCSVLKRRHRVHEKVFQRLNRLTRAIVFTARHSSLFRHSCQPARDVLKPSQASCAGFACTLIS